MCGGGGGDVGGRLWGSVCGGGHGGCGREAVGEYVGGRLGECGHGGCGREAVGSVCGGGHGGCGREAVGEYVGGRLWGSVGMGDVGGRLGECGHGGCGREAVGECVWKREVGGRLWGSVWGGGCGREALGEGGRGVMCDLGTTVFCFITIVIHNNILRKKNPLTSFQTHCVTENKYIINQKLCTEVKEKASCERTHYVSNRLLNQELHIIICKHLMNIAWPLQDGEKNQGFPTRMVYLRYISCFRYTILVGNP